MNLMVRGNQPVCVEIMPILSGPPVHSGRRKLVLKLTLAVEKGLLKYLKPGRNFEAWKLNGIGFKTFFPDCFIMLFFDKEV